MRDPDFKSYSLEELYEAIGGIDEQKFPEKAKLINAEISKKESLVKPEQIDKQDKVEHRLVYFGFIKKLKQASLVLILISFFFGSALFINYFFSLKFEVFGYKFILSFPGISNIDKNFLVYIIHSVIIFINILFVISSIGSYFKNKYFQMLLAIAWGNLSFGFEIWDFKWWPTLNSDLPLSLTFDLFNVNFGFKLNLLSLSLFFWAILINPGVRKEVVST